MTMSYAEMIEAALGAQPGKWVSRASIKAYLAANHGYVDNATSKNHLKKALAKFERKGDSYKMSKALKAKKAAASKKGANKQKLAAKTQGRIAPVTRPKVRPALSLSRRARRAPCRARSASTSRRRR